jgi:hypothetical protein
MIRDLVLVNSCSASHGSFFADLAGIRLPLALPPPAGGIFLLAGEVAVAFAATSHCFSA